ncbi:MAG: FAD-dependent oxidoreductase [Chloroflexi bacterium]|nr:FAD-dependent oxidoreductase [Chloroflexota bacterium]
MLDAFIGPCETTTMPTPLSRRRFIQLSSLAITSVFARNLLTAQPAHVQADETILVIGAGIAGLAAARRLQTAGYAVIVLEGRDRIGGRVWTDYTLGLPLDLGAAWIHGIDGNPIYDLARQWGIVTSVTDFDASAVYYGADELTDEDYAEVEAVVEELYDELEALKADLDEDKSVGAAVEELLADYGDLSARVLASVRWTIMSEIGLEMGEDLTNLSLWAWDEDEALSGDDVVFPGGYRQIVERLAEGLDIRLGQVVTALYHDGAGVEVETSSGVFVADRVIVTLPLGVLQRGLVAFDPPLPTAKQTAIDRMAMGSLDKVVLRFSAQFWPEELHSFGAADQPEAEATEFWNMAIHTGAPILVALIGGDDARQLERTNEQTVVARMLNHLRGMFGAEIPEPTAYVITRWSSDPFAYGSYSHIPPGADYDDYETLAAPVSDRVLFAGEATHAAYPATVHGAFLSGAREAERIINR